MSAVLRTRSEILSPFPVPHRIVIRETAPKDAGPQPPVVLMLHGLTRNGADFDAAAEALALRGYRCIAPDMPGRGGSDDLPEAAMYNYAVYGADVTLIARAAGATRLALVGSSMGGIIGMSLATAERTLPPETRLISRLILVDVGCYLPAAALRRVSAAAENYPKFANETEAETHFRAKLQNFGMDPIYVPHLLRHAFRRSMDGTLRYAYDPKISDARRIALGADPEVIKDLDLRALWLGVDCPVSLIRGGRSDFTPEEMAREMRGHPRFNGDYLVPEAGHVPMLETPAQHNALARMLEG